MSWYEDPSCTVKGAQDDIELERRMSTLTVCPICAADLPDGWTGCARCAATDVDIERIVWDQMVCSEEEYMAELDARADALADAAEVALDAVVWS